MRPILAIWTLAALPLGAEERYLLAAGHQVVEVNRDGVVTATLRHPGHVGIYDAWRLPDGGIAYAHRKGLAVFDAQQRLLLEYPAATEADGIAILAEGASFALLDAGSGEIVTVNRRNEVLGRTPLPKLGEDPVHSRYRQLRSLRGGKEFLVGQFGRRRVLQVEAGTGRILATLELDPLLDAPRDAHKAFGLLPRHDGGLIVTTGPGQQILRFDARFRPVPWATPVELRSTCSSYLGVQATKQGGLLMACGDYHAATAAQANDVLVELSPSGKITWRLTRTHLANKIKGVPDAKAGFDRFHIANVHAYDSAHLDRALKVER